MSRMPLGAQEGRGEECCTREDASLTFTATLSEPYSITQCGSLKAAET